MNRVVTDRMDRLLRYKRELASLETELRTEIDILQSYYRAVANAAEEATRNRADFNDVIGNIIEASANISTAQLETVLSLIRRTCDSLEQLGELETKYPMGLSQDDIDVFATAIEKEYGTAWRVLNHSRTEISQLGDTLGKLLTL